MTVPNHSITYVESLRVWEQYDYSGIERSRGDEEMSDMWRRWRQIRGKPTSATRAVRRSSLDQSWTAFIRRWNTEPSFYELVPLREEQRRRYGFAESRERVCELSWIADRPSCFVHWRKYYHHCKRHVIARPVRAQWTNIPVIVRYPRRSARELGDTSERVMITNERMGGLERTWKCVNTLHQPQ
uniref:Uncharacterized protein n=1 Tax=Hyaloperonospora arabidopsidis (strain Emoy2) TaxID=559515 RepID=M4BXQ8_HYAAE